MVLVSLAQDLPIDLVPLLSRDHSPLQKKGYKIKLISQKNAEKVILIIFVSLASSQLNVRFLPGKTNIERLSYWTI